MWNTYLHIFSLLNSLWVYQSQLRADPRILCPLSIKHDDDGYLQRGNLLHTWWVRRILLHLRLFKVPWALISRSGSQIFFDWSGRTRGSVCSVSTLVEGGQIFVTLWMTLMQFVKKFVHYHKIQLLLYLVLSVWTFCSANNLFISAQAKLLPTSK